MTTIGPAATVLLLAGGLLGTTTTAGATDVPQTASPGSLQRAAAGVWQQVSSEKVANFTEPGTFRTADGVLHVAWGTTRAPVAPNGSYTGAVVHRGITQSGGMTAESDVVSGLDFTGATPDVTARPGGIRIFVNGQKPKAWAPEKDESGVFAHGSDISGAAWVEEGTASTSDADFAATTLDDGTPMVAGISVFGGSWRTGFGEHPATGTISAPAFGALNPQITRSGSAVVVGFRGIGGTPETGGVVLQQVLPTQGAAVQAPRSGVGHQRQGPALATRSDGTIWASYATRTSAGAPLLLWQVGSSTPVRVPESEDAMWHDLGAGPDGHLWVVWGQADGSVRVTRTAASGTRFGAVTTWRPPAGTAASFGPTIEPTSAGADVLLVADTVAGTSAHVFHTRVLPGLDLSASPSRWRAGRAQPVRIRVSDAGAGVSGVRVRGGGRSCRTDGTGRCTLRLATRRPGRVTLRATAPGWVADSVVLKVRR